ncbi:MAG TPA: hypothetical protein VE964_02635 [Myxococcales bacterium]|nr:hypothetical protein [Myxococcales bacterium]
MALNLVLVPQRQSSRGMALAWGEMEGVQGYEVFVAYKRLSPEELEAAESLGGTEECVFAKVGPEVRSVVDDLTPVGEPRFYAVAMIFADGTVKPARFRAVPDGATAGSLTLSSAQGPARPAVAPPSALRPPAAAPPPRAPPAPAAAAPPAEDALEARKRAQREARARAMGAALTEPPGPAEVFGRGEPFIRVAEPGQPARQPPPPPRPQPPRAAQPSGRPPEEPVRSAVPAAAEPPAAPASVPLDHDLDLRMKGATQTWDGLRIVWEREPRAAAYEIIVSDHQIFSDELKEALAGGADFTTAVAVAPNVEAVIDNVTPRDARGWYAVLVRARDGKRAAHPFQVGDAAATGKLAAPFLNPNRTGELRAEAEGMVEEAREQWQRWKTEQDGGARAEAKRLVRDALLVFPGLASARALAAEMG